MRLLFWIPKFFFFFFLGMLYGLQGPCATAWEFGRDKTKIFGRDKTGTDVSGEGRGGGRDLLGLVRAEKSQVMQIAAPVPDKKKTPLPRFGPRDGGKQRVPWDLWVDLEGRTAGGLVGVTRGHS